MLVNGDTELAEEAVNMHLKAHGADQHVASAIGAATSPAAAAPQRR